MADIIVTWPSRRKLASYLHELERAKRDGLVINYRISRPPKSKVDRCYLVHGGQVVGYNEVIEVMRREANQVASVEGGWWPPGWYVVRRPEFFPAGELKYRGFQGWRYFDRSVLA